MASRLSRYLWKRRRLSLGSVELEYEGLQDLDQAIDVVCSEADLDDLHSVDEALDLSPYFGIVWPSALGLIYHLEKKIISRSIVPAHRILEIGCGLALPSFVATRFGGDVIATDFHADVPVFLDLNKAANNIDFEYRVMNWRSEIERTKNTLGMFDLVLGSDILYESQHSLEVAKALIAFLNPGGKIILADPGRAYIQKFISTMKELGYPEVFTTQKVPAKLTQKNIDREIYLFEFSK